MTRDKIPSVYFQALEGHRRQALLLIFILTLSGLFEGLALTALVPLLDPASMDAGRGILRRFFGSELPVASIQWVALGAFTFLGICSAVLRFLGESRAIYLRNAVEESMRRRMTSRLLQMKWSSFLSLRLGDITQAIMLEGAHTGTGVFAFVHAIALSAIAFVFLILAFLLSLKLSLLTLGFGLLGIIGYRLAAAKAEAKTSEQAETATAIGEQIANVFGNLKFIRSTGTARGSSALASNAFRAYAHASYLSQLYGALMRFGFETSGVGFVAGILGIVLYTEGRLTAMGLVFLAIFYRLSPRLMTIQSTLQQARSLRPWYLNWRQRMDVAALNQESQTGHVEAVFERSIRLDHVSFTFPGSHEPVLNDVELEVCAGECVAIVGESGSGKTTILDLVTGLLSPSSGSVTIDGTPTTALSIEEWQRRIGLVMQDSPLFHASILTNLTMGELDADEDLAWEALRSANAESFVRRLPDGLATVIGERGARLSGGERQRIALARALYRRPRLLVLDEATSALDGASEAVIQRALQGLKGSVSILMVAHRLKTVDIADRIVVLDRGMIIEHGTWQDLMARDSVFREMAARQGLLSVA